MKIPQTDRVRTYELTFLVPGSETSDVVAGVVEDIEKIIKKHKIEVVSKDDWGKRPLSYPIKHHGKAEHEANYFHLVLKAHTKEIPTFEADLRLDQKIMRSLLVLATDDDLTVPQASTSETETVPATQSAPADETKEEAQDEVKEEAPKEEGKVESKK